MSVTYIYEKRSVHTTSEIFIASEEYECKFLFTKPLSISHTTILVWASRNAAQYIQQEHEII